MREAFFRKLPQGAESECWEWPHGLTTGGYAILVHHYERQYVHRLSYEYHVGPIPAGLFVCHRCDNRRCCNPNHLFLGTAADNNADMVEKGRHRPNPRRGTSHRLAKLDDEKVRYIRSSTKTGRSLAEELGVAETLISRVRKRQCWPHVG